MSTSPNTDGIQQLARASIQTKTVYILGCWL